MENCLLFHCLQPEEICSETLFFAVSSAVNQDPVLFSINGKNYPSIIQPNDIEVYCQDYTNRAG